MALLQMLDDIEKRFIELEHMMSEPEIATNPEKIMAYGRERSELEDVVTAYRELRDVDEQIQEAEAILKDGDSEMADLAREELDELRARNDDLMRQLRLLLVPKDPNDDKSVIVEIRAGPGGDEAGLFAGDLLRMYMKYAEAQGWKVDIMSSSENEVGGYKEVIIEVKGQGAFSHLKFESGVHRVQRIPVTESGGRIHTSTASVIVLPEAEEVEINIPAEDIRVDVFRATGHGGQSVNTTDSAVRITHLPTGIIATCQDEKSQLKNRAKAMTVLRTRLFDAEQRKQDDERSGMRRSQVGTGERSEKIRTYNFPQDRVTDHRLKQSFSNLPGILEGNISGFIEDLRAAEQAERLQEAGLNEANV